LGPTANEDAADAGVGLTKEETMDARFRRDFESEEEYRRRMAGGGDEDATAPAAPQPEPPSPFIVDAGIYTSRRDREAIQAEEDRITRLERLGR
jgi:hypothetical protein